MHSAHFSFPIRERAWLAALPRWAFAAISSRLSQEGDAERHAANPAQTQDFERFFFRHEGAITGYLRRIVGDEATASDLCQETFVRAWQHFAEVSAYPRPDTWLFRVATRLALNHLRRHHSLIAAAEPFEDDVATTGDMAEQLAEGEQVRQTLLELAPRPRALLVLREVYGLSPDEAAQALGMTPAGTKKMLYRARVEFRRRYAHKEGR